MSITEHRQKANHAYLNAEQCQKRQGKDVKSTWITFPVGESERVSNQMRFVCGILDAGDLHVFRSG